MAGYIHRSLKFGPYITCICLITKSLNVIITFALGAIGIRIEFQAPVIYFLNIPENRGKGH